MTSKYYPSKGGKTKLCSLCWEEKFIPEKMTKYPDKEEDDDYPWWQSNFFSCCVDCESKAEYPAMCPTVGSYASAEARQRYMDKYTIQVHCQGCNCKKDDN